MTLSSFPRPAPDGFASTDGGLTSVAPDPAVLAIRDVHRAVAELRRGIPVLLDGAEPLVVAAAETVGANGLTEFIALATGEPVLVLGPVRAESVLRARVPRSAKAVALRLPGNPFEPATLRRLADPTAEQLLPGQPEAVPAPLLGAAALSLVKLGRLLPAALAAPARPDAMEVAARLRLLAVAAADVTAYPNALAASLRRVSEAVVPLDGASDARIVAFRGHDAGIEHLAIVIGQPEHEAAPLVRIHSECFTGDLLGSLRCDCGAQLRGAIRRMADEGCGVLLYLAQEGRGIGLVNKLRAYTLQDRGLDTLDANRALGWGADERSFLVAATMLRELGIHRVRLLTNNLEKMSGLAACGVEIVGREKHSFPPNGVNDDYLATKAERFGHLLG
jgi:GTP cyclohydrolase II